MPGQTIPMPNGLSAFQACQMAWYAGVSDHLKSFGLFEVNPETDVTGASDILGAQILWHVMEGIAHRYNDFPVRDIESYLTFHVCHDELIDGIRELSLLLELSSAESNTHKVLCLNAARALREHPKLKDACIRVSCNGKKMILEGRVLSILQKSQAYFTAIRSTKKIALENKLRIVQPSEE